MPTYTIFTTANDGHVQSTGSPTSDYASARTGGTLAADTTASSRYTGQVEFFGYICNEVFFDFDTSTVVGTITSAILSWYGKTDSSTTDFVIQARLDDFGATVTTADWVSGANLGSFTLLATYATSGGWSTAAYNVFTDVAFPANVNKTGSTRIMLSSDRHLAGTSPGVSGSEQVEGYMSEDAGTTRDPKLVVVSVAAIPELNFAVAIAS